MITEWVVDNITWIVLVILTVNAYAHYRLRVWAKTSIEKLAGQIRQEYEEKKKKSNDIARTVLRGQLLESFVPIRQASIQGLNSFDFRPFGDFCDFIVIDGYTDVKDGVAEAVNKVIFMEVKSGNAKMSKHQEAVKKAIEEGKVEWQVINVPADPKDW